MDQVTASAFASGAKGAIDLGTRLQDKKTFILIPDLASIISGNPENAIELFAMWRTLYDGYLSKHTGHGVKVYDNCHVNVFACSTPIIRKNIEFLSQMGTRELLYEVKPIEDPHSMLQNPITNEGRKEIYEVVRAYLDDLKDLNEFEELNEVEKERCETSATYIGFWRAETNVDKKGFLTDDVVVEYPPRVYKQLCKYWRGMKTLGIPFDQMWKNQIEINVGVGDRLRRQVYSKLYRTDQFGERIGLEKCIFELAILLNRSPETIAERVMILRELGLIETEPRGDPFDYTTKWTPDTLHLEARL
jgi:hypothetical protein